MKIYCDESNSDAFTSKTNDSQYLVIGAIKIFDEDYERIKDEIKKIRDKFKYHCEIKWNKVSKSKEEFYIEMINFFFKNKDRILFRCITIDKTKLNLIKYQQSDAELSFYKFYYLLLNHWIDNFESYSIYVDIKTTRVKNRLQTLKKCLSNSNISATIINLQALPSNEVILIQLADLITGAVSAVFNKSVKSPAKKRLIAEIEKNLKHPIEPTRRSERKFNVFNIELKK